LHKIEISARSFLTTKTQKNGKRKMESGKYQLINFSFSVFHYLRVFVVKGF